MRTKKKFMKKLIVVQLVLIVVLATIFNIIIANNVQATTYTQYKKTGISEFPESYQSYLKKLSELHPNWTFTAFYTGMTWNEFITNETSTHLRNTVINTSEASWKDTCNQVASGYACASKDIIQYFADPRNFLTESGIFQFLEMSYNSSVHTKAGVESIISGTFMDTSVTFDLNGKQTKMTYSEIIMEAAKETGISPYSIAIKIIQEVGRQGSSSVSGNYVGYEGYYNFFNIGAYDSGNAIENGLSYAKEKGWNNQYKSIVEGAKYLADSYIGVGQNTAYFYKFDVVSDSATGTFWHQYMTNIQDPSSQAKNLYNTYAKNDILDISLNFVIPVFNDMPNACNLPGTIDTTESTSYYVTGTGVSLREKATTSASKLATLTKNEVVRVLEFSYANSDGYTWAYIERSNGTKGYVANCYLAPCNENKQSSIARIENAYIITIPNIKLSDIVSELSITSCEIKNANGNVVDTSKNVATNYVLNNKTANKYYSIVTLGDVNGDGAVNALDALKVLKHDVGLETLNGASFKAR